MTRVIGAPAATVAVAAPAQAFALAGVASLSARRPLLIVTPTAASASELVHDLGLYLGADAVELFPAWETLPFERVSPEAETMGRRLAVLHHLAEGRAGVIVAPVKAVLQRLGPWRTAARPLEVARGDRLDSGEVVARLVAAGYRREPLVEHRGELAVRGGIIDVFPSTADGPVRLDLWGDEVDRLTAFDVGDQRSTDDLDRVAIYGCRELVPDEDVRARAEELVSHAPWGRSQWERLARGELFDGMESWLPWVAPGGPSGADGDGELLTDLLGEGSLVVLVEPRRAKDRATELIEEEEALSTSLAATWDAEIGAGAPRLHLAFDRLLTGSRAGLLSVVPPAGGLDEPSIDSRGWEPVLGDGDRLADQVRRLAGDGYELVLCSASATGAERLASTLAEAGLDIPVEVAPIEHGFVLPGIRLAVLAESDVTGRRRPHRPARARTRPVDGFFDDLAPGNYVVHRQHGVAVYAGMVTRTMGGATRDYLLLEYRGADRLYLPTDQIDALTPYTGGDAPSVNRLGGSEWQRTRAKARAAVHEIAEELVALYRRRLQVEGHAFPPDTPWQAELAASFTFDETPDQLRSIEEVTADMERPVPMDRLICGDVGFGKTEVAVRAVFKAVQDGRQAAVLVPMTLLASQHFQTFSDRYAPFPVRVEMLSRFLTDAQARKVLDGLADGSVDVVVGTHRLLGEDVAFRHLGLLVVDEEQRFGVSHKEAIKAITDGVDVLTLTASPIPRTLEMALTGIRDLSMVNTPPAARRPILTHVGEFDEAAVSEALRRELLREGQVFFVHNRVDDIDAAAERLRRLVPGARITVAHGQMDEGLLEQVVLDFWERRSDVLVCTTIIESGIDMPSVNTLVVDRADRLGLGQLHQLRGRVGRGGQRAYAYLFHPADRVLSEQAYERLRTIGDHTELGSGFKIALRDLHIRGAGNQLGRDQSGHIAAIGYDLYVQMVSEAVADLKGEARPEPIEVSVDVPDAAFLPPDYVEAEDARLEAYRRLASARSAAEIADVAAEWSDRFGPYPAPATALLDVARLRVECLRLGITDLAVSAGRGGIGAGPSGKGRVWQVKLSPITLPASAEVRLRRLAPGGTYHADLHRLLVPLQTADAGDPVAPLLVDLLSELVPAAVADVPGAEPGPQRATR